MKHSSIRLSDIHYGKIKETGKSPSLVIREALDLYFGIPQSEVTGVHEVVQKAIKEHIEALHGKHIENVLQTRHVVPQDKQSDF